MLPTASWIAFASDVMSGCHVFSNAPRCYPICHCFCLSFFGLLGLSACGFSIETAYDMVVVYIRIIRVRHYVMPYLSSGIAFYTVF